MVYGGIFIMHTLFPEKNNYEFYKIKNYHGLNHLGGMFVVGKRYAL